MCFNCSAVSLCPVWRERDGWGRGLLMEQFSVSSSSLHQRGWISCGIWPRQRYCHCATAPLASSSKPLAWLWWHCERWAGKARTWVYGKCCPTLSTNSSINNTSSLTKGRQIMRNQTLLSQNLPMSGFKNLHFSTEGAWYFLHILKSFDQSHQTWTAGQSE